VIGYTLSTVERGSGTLGRIAVTPGHRGTGVAYALLIESVREMTEAGAHTVGLCTQQSNAAAQALYARVGMRQVPGRLLFLIGDADSGGR
ncbi:MAG: GNAT family N-acetyltransferase, partial [Coriobacteriia bacterium]